MLINNQPDMVVVAQASSAKEAIEGFREHRPDVVLMDIRLPDMSGIDAMSAICQEFPEARVIMLTTSEGDVEIQRALQTGARGYMLKSMPPKKSSKPFARSMRVKSAFRLRLQRIWLNITATRQLQPVRSRFCNISPAEIVTVTSRKNCSSQKRR